MRYPSSLLRLGIGAALCAAVAGCGGETTADNATAQMANLESVDGTTNDAMTDLDGVQSEGTAMIASDNASTASGNAAAAAVNETEPDKAEVVADQ